MKGWIESRELNELNELVESKGLTDSKEPIKLKRPVESNGADQVKVSIELEGLVELRVPFNSISHSNSTSPLN